MALYRALRRGQIHVDVAPVKRGDSMGDRRVVKIVEEGEIFEHSGKPGSWMQPLEDSDDEPGGADRGVGTAQGESDGRHGKKSTSTASSKEPAGGDKP